MNNEPVAWIKQSEYGKPIIVKNPLHQFSYQAECAKWKDIPLYTHPAKTLTDEEIYQIIFQSGFDENLFNQNLNNGVMPISLILAKAILRKAQEK